MSITNLRRVVATIAGIGLVLTCAEAARPSAAIAVEPHGTGSLQSGANQPPAPAGKPVPPVNPTGAATKAFLDRIQEYVNFRNNVEKTVPRLTETADPAKISEREAALGQALIKHRPDAKPGDFFIEQYQPILLKIIKDDFAHRSLADRRALVVELPKHVTLTVNTIYPTALPLASFPPNLLEKLPPLPKELEYRIVGRNLILRDVTGNVIVDVVRDAIPIPA